MERKQSLNPITARRAASTVSNTEWAGGVVRLGDGAMTPEEQVARHRKEAIASIKRTRAYLVSQSQSEAERRESLAYRTFKPDTGLGLGVAR